jgi:hypothetical protein
MDRGIDLKKQIRKNGDWRGSMGKWELSFGMLLLCHAHA